MSDQKVVLITGSSTGFGNLLARHLAEHGHRVFATMRNVAGKNADAAAELNALANITVVDLDVTSDDSVNQAIATVIEHAGRIDVAVNNAGGGGMGFTETFSTQEVENQYNVNVFGPFRVTRAVLPHMRKQGDGLIVSVSSIMGRFSAPLFAMYCSSKYALESMAEAWRYELAPVGVDSIIVEPGAFPTTNFGQNMGAYSPEAQEVANAYGDLAKLPENFGKMLTEMVEQGQYQDPKDVAVAIAQLIDQPKGERPLRTVVAQGTEDPFNQYNEHADQLTTAVLKGWGMIQ